jgi:hypothetical protein
MGARRVLERVFLSLLVIAAALFGCGAGIAPHSASPHPTVAVAFDAALRELVRARGVESPRNIVAAAANDGRCTSGDVNRRLSCHLRARSVEVAAEWTGSAWVFSFALPDLSDHIHWVFVSRERAGELRVEVTSEN